MKPPLTKQKVQAITVAEAARRLRKATKTIYNWLDSGELGEVTTQDDGVRLVAVDEKGEIIWPKEAQT